jgi:nucleoside-diphosphate kinase
MESKAMPTTGFKMKRRSVQRVATVSRPARSYRIAGRGNTVCRHAAVTPPYRAQPDPEAGPIRNARLFRKAAVRAALPLGDAAAISARPTPSALKGTAMAIERTFSIIKPDATARHLTGAINGVIEEAGLRIIAQKRVRITREQAEAFYAVHRERPFFGELVDFMVSGPVVVQVLEGENAIAKYRDLMGATDPAKAAPGTIRKRYGESIGANSVHGSDGHDTAAREIAQFFAGNEVIG